MCMDWKLGGSANEVVNSKSSTLLIRYKKQTIPKASCNSHFSQPLIILPTGHLDMNTHIFYSVWTFVCLAEKQEFHHLVPKVCHFLWKKRNRSTVSSLVRKSQRKEAHFVWTAYICSFSTLAIRYSGGSQRSYCSALAAR
ncbi:uncharacterized protein LOC116416794 [Nasonia vitripennis]|uniref:Uncharacterized protein n=1 Tax=Nasonia vitripennis TaxID=7425 RepID=A0A7M7Q999_NASVI|nr:uncharacterized protein LOC116416794 [Nasonia vitripennis]